MSSRRGTASLRRRANMAHIRQSRPDSVLDIQVKVLKTFEVVPSSLGSGEPRFKIDAKFRVD